MHARESMKSASAGARSPRLGQLFKCNFERCWPGAAGAGPRYTAALSFFRAALRALYLYIHTHPRNRPFAARMRIFEVCNYTRRCRERIDANIFRVIFASAHCPQNGRGVRYVRAFAFVWVRRGRANANKGLAGIWSSRGYREGLIAQNSQIYTRQ